MECNKEEASRVKDVSERKLHEADFPGAKKMALKARQLFPGLENISQLLAVCEVHCSSSVKINGETDWYGILQVEPTADNMVLKKQYHRLALLLHPDKNKFAGAEAAFKLIGEAYMTLTDPVKRSSHDNKRKAVFATSAPIPKKRARASKKTDPAHKRDNKENFGAPQTQKPQQQAGKSSGVSSFWTICLSCGTKYQYPSSSLMKFVLCRICLRTFPAYDLSKKSVPAGVDTTSPWSGFGMQPQKFPPSQQAHKRGIQSQHFPRQRISPVNQQVQSQNPSFNEGLSNLNSIGMSDSNVTANARTCNNMNVPRAAIDEENGSSRTESPLASSDKVSRANIEKRIINDANGAVKTGQNPQRSSQQENNVSNEDGSGRCRKASDKLHDSPAAKRTRKGYSSCNAHKNGGTVNKDGNVYTTQKACSIPVTKTLNENVEVVNGLDHEEKRGASKKEEMRNSGRDGAGSSLDNSIPCEGDVSYPDPEFYDFEENRNADGFKADQIWAVYDDSDSMPRYYARIKQVYSPNFMVWFSWLEFDPLNDAEKAWSSKEMPVACGRFRIGKTILTEDIKMFSHVVSWTKGSKRNSYEIYPVKGEVWALFKACDIDRSSDSSDHKNYSYDIVEIKSNFAAGMGTYVTPLVKVQGFVSLFVRSDKEEPYLIPGGDSLRFSHNIPFHRLSEADKLHIPNGALELDPASLPSNLEEATLSADLNRSSTQEGNVLSNRDSFKCEMPTGKTKQGLDSAATNEGNVHNGVKKANINADDKQDNGSEASVIDADSVDQWDDSFQSESPATFVYPETEFFNFGDLRSFDNFKSGQIWALYCDTDKFPKYYAFIKRVDQDDLTIHIRWLEYCPCGEMEKRLVQDDLPASCGIFRVTSQSENYDCTSFFSHIMEGTTISKGKKYEILPCVGQKIKVKQKLYCSQDEVNSGLLIKIYIVDKAAALRWLFLLLVVSSVGKLGC
ncbi:hypothetical protein ZWY2020_005620 [Hordeum vulgare]|nr:hypothetical protein ZWY2020_005620 [Hordeum vulgare]